MLGIIKSMSNEPQQKASAIDLTELKRSRQWWKMRSGRQDIPASVKKKIKQYHNIQELLENERRENKSKNYLKLKHTQTHPKTKFIQCDYSRKLWNLGKKLAPKHRSNFEFRRYN